MPPKPIDRRDAPKPESAQHIDVGQVIDLRRMFEEITRLTSENMELRAANAKLQEQLGISISLHQQEMGLRVRTEELLRELREENAALKQENEALKSRVALLEIEVRKQSDQLIQQSDQLKQQSDQLMQQSDQLMKQQRQIDAISMTNGAIVAAQLINGLEWDLLEEIVKSGGNKKFEFAQFLDQSDPIVAEQVTQARLNMSVEHVSAICSSVRSLRNVQAHPARITEADVSDAALWIQQNMRPPRLVPSALDVLRKAADLAFRS